MEGKGGTGEGNEADTGDPGGLEGGEWDMKLIIIHMLGVFANFHFNGQIFWFSK